jgi:hypothetical protein
VVAGEVRTCASALRKLLGWGNDDRAMQRILDRLEQGGYIHRYLIPGKRGLYRLVINKYLITTGPNNGKRSQIPRKTNPNGGTDSGLRADWADGVSGSEVGSEDASG